MRITLTTLCCLLVAGCASTYYGAMESFGIHKREILVDRISDAMKSQEEAKEQFASALDQFRSVVTFDGGDLEDLYERLADELEDSEDEAEEVEDRIASVKRVARDLFKEWEDELDQYSDASLRSKSQAQLRDTERRYEKLMAAMERAESRIDPVLSTFRDQVLFLKHNLNARAVASLKTELTTIETDVDSLIQEMERSISEATEFIDSMSA